MSAIDPGSPTRTSPMPPALYLARTFQPQRKRPSSTGHGQKHRFRNVPARDLVRAEPASIWPAPASSFTVGGNGHLLEGFEAGSVNGFWIHRLSSDCSPTLSRTSFVEHIASIERQRDASGSSQDRPHRC